MESKPLLLTVVGHRSSAGKSTFCLGLLASLLNKSGFSAEDLAYIKPATQCSDVQLVSKYCNKMGIAHRGIGPVVFYTGFTREIITKKNQDTPATLVQKCVDAITEISKNKKLVLIDGVGYPSVGSIVGCSSAHIAAQIPTAVLLIGKHGCGDAVDSMNLCQAWYEKFNVPILGGVFNKIQQDSYDDLKFHVTEYFKTNQPNFGVYGFIPETKSLVNDLPPSLKTTCQLESPKTLALSAKEEELISVVAQNINTFVDTDQILKDLRGVVAKKK
eukprot:TRINITY_DN8955_c0_g1_i1.p1 TRINITY_DN8955_c0_g1~~TRINITY_DN8955_c0_g1_i1.p1  ORF type:complete len:273 (-),score=45.65 TRINITY_DN8955_c0_g1_i1:15-833(-)